MENNLYKLYSKVFRYKKERRFSLLKKALMINNTTIIQNDIIIGNPKKLLLENYVYIGPRAVIQTIGKVTIKRGVIIGPDLRIYSGNHKFKNSTLLPYDHQYEIKDVIIEENVWVGGSVIILPGVTIGEGSIIGAGSVVAKSIPKFNIDAGNPSKIIGKRDEEIYYKLKKKDAIYMKEKLSRKIKS